MFALQFSSLPSPLRAGASTVLALLVLFTLAGCGGSSDEAFVSRAETYYQDLDYRAAIVELKNALQQNVNNAEARLLLGRIYVEVGNGQSAEKEINRALKLGIAATRGLPPLARALMLQKDYQGLLRATEVPADATGAELAEILALRGDAYVAMGKEHVAAKVFKSALKAYPKSVAALLGRARLHAVASRLDAAEADLTLALEQQPERAESWDLRARVARLRSDPQAAVGYYRKVLALTPAFPITARAFDARANLAKVLLQTGDVPAALEQVEYLLQNSPKHPTPRYLRALVSYQQQELAESEVYLLQALNLNSRHLPSTLLLGAVDFARGQLEQANLYLGRYLAVKPRDLLARKLLGSTRMKMRQPEAALEALRGVARIEGVDVELLRLIAQASLGAGNIEAGIERLQKALDAAPDDPALRTDLASAYLAKGDADRALEELQRPDLIGKQGGKVGYLRVVGYLSKKDFDAALKEAQKLVSEYGEQAQAVFVLGSVREARGEMEQAREIFEQVLERQQDYVPALLKLAVLAEQDKRDDAARDYLHRALAVEDENLTALMALGRLADRAGRTKKALEYLQRARRLHPDALAPRLLLARHFTETGELAEALAVGEEAIKGHPNAVAALAILGRAQMLANQPADAAESFERLSQRLPQSAVSQYLLASARVKLEQWVAARRALNRALDLKPGFVRAMTALGALELQDGNTEAALNLAGRIRERAPGSPYGYAIAADVFINQGDFGRAVEELATAYKQDPSSDVAIKLAFAQAAAGRMAESIQVLSERLSKYPDELPIRIRLAAYLLETGDVEGAKREYQRILGLAPGNVEALNNMAWLLDQENDGRALDLANRAYRLDPGDASVADTLGWILVRVGQAERGLKVLRRANDLAPNSAAIQYHLAVALARSGRKADAETLLKSLLGSDNSFQGREAAQELLKRL